MAPLIEFHRVSKAYRLRRESPTAFRDFFIRGLQGKLRLPSQEQLWAVRDLSFAIERGETVGFIGDNGAGKSTTLKLISQLIVPTRGRVRVNGRVSALLELGTGFHPDLSGRDNIFLSGSLIGLSQRDIRRKFDSIVEFSELADYMDMPVKHYSSGMFARLAFAVSIHLDPEVLLVDEVLAVGDMAFQQKCFDKISELKRQGVTIIMVSHSHTAITQHCTRALWLQHGRLMADGYADSVVRRYVESVLQADSERMMLAAQTAQAAHAITRNAEMAEPEPSTTPEAAAVSTEPTPTAAPAPPPPTRWGNGKITIDHITLTNAQGMATALIRPGEVVMINLHYTAHQPITAPVFGIAIHRHDGVHICGPNTAQAGLTLPELDGPGRVCLRLSHWPLLDGLYHLSAAVVDGQTDEMFDYHDRTLSFRVKAPYGYKGEIYGLMALGGEWLVEPAMVTA